jgi:hypothetical protein
MRRKEEFRKKKEKIEEYRQELFLSPPPNLFTFHHLSPA